MRTLHQISERVAAEYGLGADEAVDDTVEMLSQLVEHDVLEIDA